MHKTPGAAANAVVHAASRQWAEHEDCRDDITILVAFLDNVPESVRWPSEHAFQPCHVSKRQLVAQHPRCLILTSLSILGLTCTRTVRT